jgi:hypothetical protein
MTGKPVAEIRVVVGILSPFLRRKLQISLSHPAIFGHHDPDPKRT